MMHYADDAKLGDETSRYITIDLNRDEYLTKLASGSSRTASSTFSAVALT